MGFFFLPSCAAFWVFSKCLPIPCYAVTTVLDLWPSYIKFQIIPMNIYTKVVQNKILTLFPSVNIIQKPTE